MKCKKCGEEVAVQPGKSTNFCSNCGNKIETEKASNWKYFDNTKDLLAHIAAEYGLDALFSKKYLSDHASPMLPQGQKRLVSEAFSCDAVKTLQDNMNADQQNKEIAAKQAVKKLTDLMFSQEAAERVVWEFTNAIGWGMPEPQDLYKQQTGTTSSDNGGKIAEPSSLSDPNADKLMILGWQCAEDGDWTDAAGYFTRARESNPYYAPVFLGLLCVDLKISEEGKLTNIKAPDIITSHKHFKRAIADSNIKKRLDGYVQTIDNRIKAEQAIAAKAERKRKAAEEAVRRIDRNYSFGGFDWRVLDIQDDKVLLLSDKIVEQRTYSSYGVLHEDEVITWENCSLRKYLNGEFYNKLGVLKSNISETRNTNPNYPWFKAEGGNVTFDKVFLLSIEEVIEYFGDSGSLTRRKGTNQDGTGNGKYIHDRYNSARIATNKVGKACCWWLRSSASYYCNPAMVTEEGSLGISGYNLEHEISKSVGVRPAIWLNLE